MQQDGPSLLPAGTAVQVVLLNRESGAMDMFHVLLSGKPRQEGTTS